MIKKVFDKNNNNNKFKYDNSSIYSNMFIFSFDKV